MSIFSHLRNFRFSFLRLKVAINHSEVSPKNFKEQKQSFTGKCKGKCIQITFKAGPAGPKVSCHMSDISQKYQQSCICWANQRLKKGDQKIITLFIYNYLWCVAWFGTICTILKKVKTSWIFFTFFKLYKWYQIE